MNELSPPGRAGRQHEALHSHKLQAKKLKLRKLRLLFVLDVGQKNTCAGHLFKCLVYGDVVYIHAASCVFVYKAMLGKLPSYFYNLLTQTSSCTQLRRPFPTLTLDLE